MTKIKNNKIKIPAPKKYLLTYRDRNGAVTNHVVSLPIEGNDEMFTAYSFKKGVRSFKKSGVLEMTEIVLGKPVVFV